MTTTATATMTINRLDHEKVTAQHLQRLAYLYVRQSSLRQRRRSSRDRDVLA